MKKCYICLPIAGREEDIFKRVEIAKKEIIELGICLIQMLLFYMHLILMFMIIEDIIINILMVMEMLKIIGLMTIKLYIMILLAINPFIAVRKVNIILKVLKVVFGLENILFLLLIY